MRSSVLGPLLALGALAIGCHETVDVRAPDPAGTAPPTVPVPSVTATETPAPKDPTPVLLPLAADARPACDAAAELRKKADLLHGQGRSYRALRTIESADSRCSKSASDSWATRLDALSKLGMDTEAQALAKEILAAASAPPAAATAARAVAAKSPPASPPSGQALLAQALTAKKSGAADAQNQLDRAVARLAQEASEPPRPFLDQGGHDALALSRDGATAVLSSDNAAIFYDTKDFRPRRLIEQPKRKFERGAFSPDGRQIALTDDAGYVTLWSTETGKLIRKLSWASEDPGPLVFSADGQRLIVASRASWETSVRVWNLSTFDSADSFSIEKSGDPTALALSRDGKTIAVGTARGTLETWSLSPKKKLVTLSKKDSYSDQVVSLAFAPKGDKLAAMLEDGRIIAFDAKSGKELWKVSSSRGFGHGGVGFSADGTRVLGGTREGFSWALCEWDAATGSELQKKPIDGEVELFAEDGKVALGADREHAGVIDVAAATTKKVTFNELRSSTLLFGPPRTLVLAARSEKAFRVVSPDGQRFIQTSDDYGSIALSVDGSLAARGGWRESTVFDLRTGKPVAGYPAFPDTSPSLLFGASPTELRAFYGRPDEVKLYSATPGARAWREIGSFGKKGYDSLTLAQYGATAVARDGNKVLLVDPKTGDARTVDDDPKERPEAIELSADGRALFVARQQHLTRYDTATGRASHPEVGIGCWGSRIAPSFDGARLAVQCSERVEMLTFGKEGEGPSSEKFDVGRVQYEGLEIAPHGDLLAVLDDDGHLRVLDHKGALRLDLLAFAGTDAALAMSPSGRALLLGQDRASVEDRVFCRVGALIVPFAACEDALGDDDLLRDALAPAN